MKLLALAAIVIGCLSASSGTNTASSVQKITERAFSRAVSVGDSTAACYETIGKADALALVRYCRMVSSATRPPCNSHNDCALILYHIKKMCIAQKDRPTNPQTLREACLPMDPWHWKRTGQMPAL